MSNTIEYGNSSLWLGKYSSDANRNFYSDKELATLELYRLAAKKRAIANFVSIVTSQKIPVQFASSGDSYTDGKSVVISSKLEKPADFDVAVGLALHEGSHIKLSSFDILTTLHTKITSLPDYLEIDMLSSQTGISIIDNVKDILNWVEDRRIDNFIYETSPGYRPYYVSMYDRYFNDPLIEKALKSNEYTTETFDSYIFRLINLQSKSTRLNALKGLREISKIADLDNIGRLQSTNDAFNVAVSIFKVILKSVDAAMDDNQPNSQKSDSSTGNSEKGGNKSNSKSNQTKELTDEEFDELLDSLESGVDSDKNEADSEKKDNKSKNSKKSNKSDIESSDESEAGDNDESEAGDSGESEAGDDDESEVNAVTITLTDSQKETLKRKISDQKEFINGKVSKSKISKENSNTIEIIEKAGAEINEVGSDYTGTYTHLSKSINCIFVKNMNIELMETDSFPLTQKTYTYGNSKISLAKLSLKSVEAGVRLGSILGKRLQTHSETRETVFNRQLVGKLDRRMVASLGYGSEQVFFTREIDKYNKVNLHVSIDASGSMKGVKWENTMTNVVALAKAVDMIPTMEIQITFRTSSDSLPYIVMAYDSRKDKFSKILQLFPYLNISGTTPEGLCFEAISKHMVASSNNLDSYFLNISDGEPYFYGRDFYYSGMEAARHTKKMIDGMNKIGIRVLSYFVSDKSSFNENSIEAKTFRESYGKAAKFIDVTSVNEVSRTMNKLFIEK